MLKGKRLFKAYEVSQYKEMMAMLSTINHQQFREIKLNDMTLLHHIAFDANIEALEMLRTLPYFEELLNEANNEVPSLKVLNLYS